MNVTELYRRLALGELSNLGLAEDEEIDPTKRPTIILYANEGLKRLYSKFLLKEDTLFIDQIAGRTSYPLDSKYAISNTDVGNTRPRFINDIGRPFNNDVIKVMAVYNDLGIKLALNDVHRYDSAHTPQPALLQIPYPVAGTPLAVLYQAAHPELSSDQPEQSLELPEFLMGALTAFIAYKVFSHMNTQESTIKAGEHLKTYESICIEAVDQDLVSAGSMTSGIRFEKNGWA